MIVFELLSSIRHVVGAHVARTLDTVTGADELRLERSFLRNHITMLRAKNAKLIDEIDRVRIMASVFGRVNRNPGSRDSLRFHVCSVAGVHDVAIVECKRPFAVALYVIVDGAGARDFDHVRAEISERIHPYVPAHVHYDIMVRGHIELPE